MQRFTNFILHSAGNGDIFLVKFLINGSHLWTRTIGSIGFDQGSGVVVDSTGAVWLTGYTDAIGWLFLLCGAALGADVAV